MQYRKDRAGQDISILGFGCMRFSKKGMATDLEKTEEQILKAVELGVNYFDTAYIYPGSEAALGEIISRNNLRSRVKIATKLPQYLIRNSSAMDRYFSEQLDRLKTDYIDYYLMHMLTDITAWNSLKKLGIEDWIARKKAEGKIHQIGFSFHGDTEMFLKILEAYDWDFCQIQYNYLDQYSQAGEKGLKAAAAKGIPVIIMEPLRGGKLVQLPENARKQLSASGRNWTPAELALRWLWNQKEVTCVLSGMNSMDMVQENCRVASVAVPDSFTDQDHALTQEIKKCIQEKVRVGCTACRYCMPCPKNVDIPSIFSAYNNMYTESKWSARSDFIRFVGLRKNSAFATECVGCGKCEQHCPQHIPIREKLKEADKALRPLPVKIAVNILRAFIVK